MHTGVCMYVYIYIHEGGTDYTNTNYMSYPIGVWCQHITSYHIYIYNYINISVHMYTCSTTHVIIYPYKPPIYI